MIDKDTTAAVSADGKLSEKQIIELKELARTRALEIEKRLRERSDPFAQLDKSIKNHENGEQIALEFDCSEQEAVLVRDVAFEVIEAQIKHVQVFAAVRGEKLLFENLRCDHCESTDVAREIFDNRWRWECRNCARQVDDKAATQQMSRLFDEMRATSSDQSIEDFENGIEVFSIEDIKNLTENVRTVSSDEYASTRIKSTLRHLLKIGTIRPYVVPQNVWQGQLDELRENFPNFINAIDEAVEPSLAIAAAGGRARPAPLLLVGPPGVGKTFFSSLIADILKTPMFKIDLASATAGSSIDGLATHWSNSHPGELFKTLAFGRGGVDATACPVGFLDEIDKVGGDKRYDPIGALYSLLEVESAKNFEDQSLPGLRIDASHVRWIACANDLETIPKPILSRFHIVHVAAPTAAETQNMFEKIFEHVVRDTQLRDFSSQISRSVISSAVEKFSAREFKPRAVMAIGRALARNRHFVEARDFGTAPAPVARKMGF